MILDSNLLFSDSQAITAIGSDTSTATGNSTNIIDLGASGRDITPANEELDIEVLVTTAHTASGSATLGVKLVTDDDSAFGSAVTLFDTGDIAKATLVAGYKIRLGRLNGPTKRYLKLIYTVKQGPFTAGKVSAFLTTDAQNWKAYSAPNQA